MGEPLPPLPLAMCDTYCRGILRVMVGQVLEKLEFDSVSAASRDTLTDILQAYIEELGHVSHNASELANRTEANAHDVLVAFDDCNLSLQDLRAYCDESDEIPLCHEVRQVPVRKRRRPFPEASGAAGEQEDRKHIHSWLPKLPSKYKYRASEGPDLMASLSNNDPARGTEMRQAEDALVHLREKVPSAFSGAQEAKMQVAFSMPHASDKSLAQNPYLREATITAASDLTHGRDSVRSGALVMQKDKISTPSWETRHPTAQIEYQKVNQILKLEHADGIDMH